MSRGKIIAAIVALVVIGVVVAGVIMSAQGAVPQVTTAKVSKRTLGVTVTASGKLEAADKVDVYPPTAGVLESVEVTDGQKVAMDDVLAVMDEGPLQIQVAQARAGLEAANAQLEAVNKGVPAAIDKAAASAGETVARSQYDVAKATYDAQKAAYDAATPGLKPSLVASLTAARISEEQAYAGLLQAQSGVNQLSTASKVSAARASARASADQAAVALSVAEDALANAAMEAPTDGIVIFNAVGSPGTDGSLPKPAAGVAVAPQAAPFTIVQFSTLNFDAQVDEADIDRVKTGMNAAIRLDALPSESIEGRVVTIRPAAVQTTTGGIAFPVLISVDAAERNLLLGMSGSVDIEVSAVPDALTVPIEALFDENGKKYVFVISDGTVSKKEVTTGALTDTEAEIISGVDEGAEVAVGNLSNLKDGAKVRTK